MVLLTLMMSSFATNARNICKDERILFGYFNGMNTTQDEAHEALNRFKELYGFESPFPHDDAIDYELFYNQTQGVYKDIVEMFEQRFIEQNPEFFAGRYEFVHEVQAGGGDMINALQKYEQDVLVPKYGEQYQAKLQELDRQIEEIAKDMSIAKMLDYQKPDYANYAEYKQHRTKIDEYLQNQHKLLFVAYSQGNLFANAAYDYTLALIEHPNQLQILHIAPASTKLNGFYVLSSKDRMIKNRLNKWGSLAFE